MKRGCKTYGDEDILAFIIGDSTPTEDEAVASHLAVCPACRERAEAYRALDRSAAACRGGPVIRWRGFETPFGTMRIAASRSGLVELSWRSRNDDDFIARLEHRYVEAPVVCDGGELERAEHQLREYFARRRETFDLPVDLSTVTDFQRAVLEEAARLGFGEVATYRDIATRIGRPRSARAVGNALGSNPVAIIVPCHRVVRSDGSLGGYTGGLEYKETLLDLEGRSDLLDSSRQPAFF